MQRYRFKKIDAFVEAQSMGNPAGCVYLKNLNDLPVEGMQQIALELAGFVSEVKIPGVEIFVTFHHPPLRVFQGI